MTALILPNNFVNDTTADAIPVDGNFTEIEQYVNSEVITRDGSVGMIAPLLLASPVTQPLHAATKAYVDAVMPVGIMMPYAGLEAPGGGVWALCNGAELSQVVYNALFVIVGTRFGTASTGNFKLPNTAGRMLVGVDATDTVAPATDVVGKTGGSTTPPLKTHTHKIDHNHGVKTSAVQNVNHTHQIAHNHGSVTTSSSGVHDHDSGYRGIAATAGSVLLDGGIGTPGETSLLGTLPDGAHTHTVDLPALPSTQSGNNSVGHTHTVDLDLFAGTTPAPVETADTKYRPPYLTISYIIRIA